MTISNQSMPVSNTKSTLDKQINFCAYCTIKGFFAHLTMHGVTKPIDLDVLFEGKVKNQVNKKDIAVFTIKGILKRSEFNIGSKFPVAAIGNEVTINATAEMSPIN